MPSHTGIVQSIDVPAREQTIAGERIAAGSSSFRWRLNYEFETYRISTVIAGVDQAKGITVRVMVPQAQIMVTTPR